MKTTHRGFSIYEELKDSYDQDVIIQRSSSVIKRVWIFCNKDGKSGLIHLGEYQSYTPHLSPKDALKIAFALIRFAVFR